MPWVNHLVEHTVGVLNIRRSNSASKLTIQKVNFLIFASTDTQVHSNVASIDTQVHSNVASTDTQVHSNFASIDTGAS